MPKKKSFLLAVLALSLGVILVAAVFRNEIRSRHFNEGSDATSERGTHLSFSMEKSSYGKIESIALQNFPTERIYGGIVSHHLLASKEIAKFFMAFGRQSPKTFVIIGPNHFNIGEENISISEYDYETPWGRVESDNEYVKKIVASGAAQPDENPFSKEHSISALASYVRYYFPEAKIVAIAVKKKTDVGEAERLAGVLGDVLRNDAVVVSSADFSHHLDLSSANFHDARSISAIASFDYERVLGSEIDSPISIFVLLKYLQAKKAEKIEYSNLNSTDFMGDPFSDDVTSYLFAHFFEGKKSRDKKISVLNFGDLMLGRGVEKSAKDGLDPFERIRGREGNFLRGVDFISANLEGVITDSNDCKDKEVVLKTDPGVADIISKSGINIFNVANNHVGDCREEGINDTKKSLTEKEADFFGSFAPEEAYVEREVNGQKMAFIGIDAVNNTENLDGYYNLIGNLRQKNDYILVNVHWGYEYHEAQSEIQTKIAHNLIDSGADLIIGHHPHVIQPVEIYKGRAIFYSLGNFVFDQPGPKTRVGMGVGVVFNGRDFEYHLFPYDIVDFQPTLRSPKDSKTFCDEYLKKIGSNAGCSFKISS